MTEIDIDRLWSCPVCDFTFVQVDVMRCPKCELVNLHEHIDASREKRYEMAREMATMKRKMETMRKKLDEAARKLARKK